MRNNILEVPEYIHHGMYTRYGRETAFYGVDPGDVLDAGVRVYPESDQLRLLREACVFVAGQRSATREFVDRMHNADEATITLVVTTFNNAGGRHYIDGNYTVAERLYADALRIAPGYAAAMTRYGNTLLQQARFGDATIVYERIMQLKASDEYPLIIEGLNTILTYEPDRVKPRHLLTSVYALLGRLEEAVGQVEHGLAIDPKNQTYLNDYKWLAEIYREHGNVARANSILERLSDTSATDLQ